jgi:hypothetical protein
MRLVRWGRRRWVERGDEVRPEGWSSRRFLQLEQRWVWGWGDATRKAESGAACARSTTMREWRARGGAGSRRGHGLGVAAKSRKGHGGVTTGSRRVHGGVTAGGGGRLRAGAP